MSLWTLAGITWKELGRRLWRQIWVDEVLGRCAELAYFFLLSIFPLLLFLTTLLGYVTQASAPLRQSLFAYISRISPSADVTALLFDTLTEVTAGRGRAKLSLGLVGAVWVASNGMIAVSRTLNAACGLKENRPWWKRRLIAIVLTVTFAVLIISALAVIFYGGSIGEALAAKYGFASFFTLTWRFLQWPLVLLFVLLSFEMVYNYGPNLGATAHREWGTPGAVTGVTLWLAASFGLRTYLSYFHAYTTAYGSLGAVILLLLWFYLTAFAILMGGEVNSEIGLARTEEAARKGLDVKALREAKRRHRLRHLRQRLRARRAGEEILVPPPEEESGSTK